MLRSARKNLAGLFTLLGLLASIAPANASFSAAYCSTQNTGSGSGDVWQYQSNGWCTGNCAGSAFAILLGKTCWCSNYAPGQGLASTSDCNDPCAGFPDDKCGNEGKSLYLYLQMSDTAPSGTKGGSSPTPASTSQASSTTVPVEKLTVVPQTSTRIITQSGNIVTETVVTTPTVAPAQNSPEKSSSNNTGAIVGGAVGGVVGLLAIAGLVVFLLFRRRRQQQQADQEEGTDGVHRNVSTMSRSGLLRTGNTPPMTQYPTPIATSFNNRRQSSHMDQESISPGSDRRNSRHLVDQRLNPSTIMYFDNSSTGSVASMDDSRDYHRPLNVRNPDPS